MEIEKIRNEAARLGYFNKNVENLIKAVKSNLITIFKNDTNVYQERLDKSLILEKELMNKSKAIKKNISKKSIKLPDTIFTIAGLFLLNIIFIFGFKISLLIALVFCGLSISGGILNMHRKIQNSVWKSLLFISLALIVSLANYFNSLNLGSEIILTTILSFALGVSVYILNELFNKWVMSTYASIKYIYNNILLLRINRSIKLVEIQVANFNNSIKEREEELRNLIDRNVEAIRYEYELGSLARKYSDSSVFLKHIGSNELQEVTYA